MAKIPQVCHVVISLNHGGLEKLVVDWTNARNRRQPGSTAVCCLDVAGDLAGDVLGDAVFCLEARRGRFPWDMAAVTRLRTWAVARGATTILHSHNLAAQQYAALAARGTGLGHLHTEHGSNVHVAGLKNILRHRLLARATDLLVAVSGDTARRMAAAWGVRAEQVRVIPNGVAPHVPAGDAAVAALRREFGVAENGIVIGTVGRLATVKGFDRLLEFLPAVLAQIPHAVCVLVGDGPERATLEARSRQLDLDDRVHFAGFRRDTRAFYEWFDLYVAPSRSEGLPVALLEAMAAGCPVLVTDVGEQRAVLDDGRAGGLLPENAHDWAGAIVARLHGEGRAAARHMAEQARRRVSEQYGLARTLDAYEGAYRALAAGTA